MNTIREALEELLNNSTPEELQAELCKGNRPYLQTLDDPVFLVAEPKFTFPAKVSFYQGEFERDQGAAEPDPQSAAESPLALAA
jgi:hypothetical protein